MLCFTFMTYAQQKMESSNTTELLRRDGKIYAVVAVCLTILLGLFVYLFLIDRKISRLEKQQQSH